MVFAERLSGPPVGSIAPTTCVVVCKAVLVLRPHSLWGDRLGQGHLGVLYVCMYVVCSGVEWPLQA